MDKDKFTRRKFIGTAVTAGAVVASGGASVIGQIASGRSLAVGKDKFAKLGWNEFLPFVNTDFTFGQGRNAVVMQLVDITDSRPLGSKARASGQENFVLEFVGSARTPLGDGTYKVNHFDLGDFDMFITAAGKKGKLNAYTAVINRVTTPE